MTIVIVVLQRRASTEVGGMHVLHRRTRNGMGFGSRPTPPGLDIDVAISGPQVLLKGQILQHKMA